MSQTPVEMKTWTLLDSVKIPVVLGMAAVLALLIGWAPAVAEWEPRLIVAFGIWAGYATVRKFGGGAPVGARAGALAAFLIYFVFTQALLMAFARNDKFLLLAAGVTETATILALWGALGGAAAGTWIERSGAAAKTTAKQV